MAEALDLWSPDDLRAPLQTTPPLQADQGCRRCDLHEKNKVACIRPEGPAVAAGSVLVVADYPGAAEDQANRPFVSQSLGAVRALVKQTWKGPVVLDTALKCAPRSRDIEASHLEACAPYLAQTIRDAAPDRILAMGGVAIRALTGRTLAPFSVRRSVSWLRKDLWPQGGWPNGLVATRNVPIYMMVSPLAAAKNTFVQRWFKADLAWALTNDPGSPPAVDAQTLVVRTPADGEAAYMDCLDAWAVTFDVETVGRPFMEGFRIVALSIHCHGPDTRWSWGEAELYQPATNRLLLQMLADPSIAKRNQNIKFDALCVRAALGTVVRGIDFDSMLVRRMLNTEGDADLETTAELVSMGGHKGQMQAEMAAAITGMQKAANSLRRKLKVKAKEVDFEKLDDEQANIIRRGSNPRRYAYGEVQQSTLLRYNARDVLSTGKLSEYLERQLALEPDIERVWQKIVRPACEAFTQIEAWGMPCDRQAMRLFSQHLQNQIKACEVQFAHYPGFNPASPSQVAKLLFQTLGMKPTAFTATGAPATGEEVLMDLAHRNPHPVLQAIVDHRGLVKMDGTYARGLQEHVALDGRIHSTFNLGGARTGRLSSDSPNLQNIPTARTPEGQLLRNCFTAGPGNVIVELDYSQLELRVAADQSGDPLMKAIFDAGEDYHLRTAQLVAGQVWGIQAADVGDNHRQQAKTVNFRTLYGGSDYANAKALGISKDQAARLRHAIFGHFGGLANFITTCLADSRQSGVAWTWWDGHRARRRSLYQIGSRDADDPARSIAENSSFNTPIQGSANDYCLASAVALVEWIVRTGFPAMLVNTVHDAIMFEVPERHVEELVLQARAIMLSWPTRTGVPLDVDCKVGTAWGAMKKYQPPAVAAAVALGGHKAGSGAYQALAQA